MDAPMESPLSSAVHPSEQAATHLASAPGVLAHPRLEQRLGIMHSASSESGLKLDDVTLPHVLLPISYLPAPLAQPCQHCSLASVGACGEAATDLQLVDEALKRPVVEQIGLGNLQRLSPHRAALGRPEPAGDTGEAEGVTLPATVRPHHHVVTN
eukprot:1928489-Rhodomonas_salina.1